MEPAAALDEFAHIAIAQGIVMARDDLDQVQARTSENDECPRPLPLDGGTFRQVDVPGWGPVLPGGQGSRSPATAQPGIRLA